MNPAKSRPVEPYVFTLATLAGLGTAGAFALVVQPGVEWRAMDLLLFVGLTAGYVFLQRRSFVLYWRKQRILTTLDEPMVYLSLVVLPFPAGILVVFLGTIAAQVMAARKPLKSLYNIAGYTLACTVAAVVFVGATRLGLAPLLAGLPSIFAYTLTSNLLVSGIFSRVEGEPVLKVFWQRFRVSTPLHGFLGGSFGFAAVVMASYHPLSLVLLAPMTLLALGFAKLDAGAEREILVRRRLAQMDQQLVANSDQETVVESVLVACQDMFLAGKASITLVLPTGEERTWEREYEGGPADAPPLDSPIVGHDGRRLGSLSIWSRARRKEALGEVDRPLLDIVAGRAATALERARAMRELLHLKNLHEEIVQHVPAGVVRVDHDGRILQANAFLLRALGGAPPPPPGESVFAWAPLQQVPEFYAQVRGVLHGEAFYDYELRLSDARGTTLSASGVPLPDDKGAIVLFSDVTAQKQAAEAMRSQTMTRPFVRRLVLNLVGGLNIPRETIASVGRSLARELALHDMQEYAAAFRATGLGNLHFDRAEGERFFFVADDLLEKRVGASQPTCHLALGFLEGAVGATHEGAALGTELRCQSKGHAQCVFVVQPRAHLAATVTVRRPAANRRP